MIAANVVSVRSEVASQAFRIDGWAPECSSVVNSGHTK